MLPSLINISSVESSVKGCELLERGVVWGTGSAGGSAPMVALELLGNTSILSQQYQHPSLIFSVMIPTELHFKSQLTPYGK